MAELAAIDCIIIACLMLCSVAIGVYYAWTGRKGNNEDFLMGGRRMSVFPVCLSYMASFMNPTAMLGYPAEVYSKGPNLIFLLVGVLFSSVVAAELFIPIYYKLKLTSVNTYLMKRFKSDKLRKFSSLSISLCYILWLGVILYSPSLVLSATTGFSVNTCILMTGVCVTIYTSIGGLKAVIWTDVFQFTFMIGGMIAIISMGVVNVGSVNEVWKRVSEGGRLTFNTDFDLYTSSNVWTVTLGFMFTWSAANSIDQILIQRTCSLPTLKKAKKVIYYCIPGFATIHLFEWLLGLIMFANYYKCDPVASGRISRIDEIVPLFVQETFASISGLTGLFVACICSAALSTLSSGINAIAALLWEDVVSKQLPNVKPITEVFITKIIAASLGALCIAMAFISSQFGTVFEASFALSAAPMGPLFAIFFMGVLFPFVNAKGAAVALISGQVFCFVINTAALINKPPNRTLLSSNENCNISNNELNEFLLVQFANLTDFRIPKYNPQGWDRLFHITFLLTPFIGFTVSVTVGVIISLLTGCNRDKTIDINLSNGFAVRFWKADKVTEN